LKGAVLKEDLAAKLFLDVVKCDHGIRNPRLRLPAVEDGLEIWPERAPSRQSGIDGVKGHNMNDNTLPGSPALWARSFTFRFGGV
jgi:hypothetical protein